MTSSAPTTLNWNGRLTALLVIGSILLFARLPGGGLESKQARVGNQSPRKS